MVTVCVKINRIIMFVIFSIVVVALALLILSAFRGGKRAESPEVFLKNLGYSYKLVAEKKIAIPKNFGENMQKFNELQKKQGFDLKKYAGKICVQKQYVITGSANNAKNNKLNDDYIADLIVFDGTVVGGNLRSQLYGSQIKSLNALAK